MTNNYVAIHTFLNQTLRLGFLIFFLLLSTAFAVSDASDDDFEIVLDSICQAGPLPVDLFIVCNNAFPSGSLAAEGGAAAFSTSSNLDTSGAPSTVSNNLMGLSRLDVKDEVLFELENNKSDWGVVLAVQTGELDRKQTDLENGFDSDLTGILLGLDYHYSDNYLFGASFNRLDDDADFDDGAGKLDTENDSILFYMRWLASEKVSVDLYFGTADADFDGEREATFGNISGTIENTTSSSQTLVGLSATKQWHFNKLSVSGFLAYDKKDTDIDDYTETGNTGLELIYPDQDIESETISIGAYLSYSNEYAWGLLVPHLRVAAVHESSGEAGEITTQLALSPGPVLTIDTDDPDRNYGLVGLGLAGRLNNGQKWFVEYENRISDNLIDYWTLNVSYLVEFK